MAKLKENYMRFSVSLIGDVWIKTKSDWTDTSPGVHLNPNVVWPAGMEADYMAKGAAMKTLEEAAPTGTQTQKDDARAARVAFKKVCGTMAVAANAQCGGDEAKLKSTGFTLNAVAADAGEMDVPVIESADAVKGVVGREEVVMKKSVKFCHGTWIELTDVATGTVTLLYTHSKHKLILTDLTPQKKYSVRVAYDGTNPLKVWSDPKAFWAQ
jgi:hypothetical protein